jgi:hypothetical protein
MKADKSNIQPMYQEVNIIFIAREHYVFLSEAYHIPNEVAQLIEPMTDKQAMEIPEWETRHETK